MNQNADMKVFAGKKILIIVENLPCPFDRRVWQEAKTISENGALVMIICPKGKGYEKRHEIINGIAIYRHSLPKEGIGFFGYLIEYSAALAAEFAIAFKCLITKGFDVIHICNPPNLLFLIALPFKLLGKKVVYDHHDICPELYMAKYGKKSFTYKLMLFLEKMTFRYSDISIATNSSYRDIALRRGGMNPGKVFTVRSGPDLERLKILAPDEELKKGRKYLVGYVGVVGRQEGLNYLVDAVHYIVNSKNRQDIGFICIGGGTHLAEIIKYTQEKGLAGYFTFTGRVSDSHLLKVLNSCEVCVNPDEYNEMNDKSTMNKIMEYMALGKPIVQFDLKEGRFSAGEASLYARHNDSKDFGDKILFLLDNEKIRTEMGKAGRKRIENYLCWDVEKENLIKAYTELFRN